ncbi:MAG: ATP-binding protein [Salinivirgaceae bacterium]
MNRCIVIVIFLLFTFNSKSQSTIENLLNLVDTTKQDINQVDLYFQLAEKYQKSDNQKAIGFSQKGLTIAELLNDSARMAIGYLRWGTALSNLSYFYLALEKYTVCKEIVEKTNDTLHLGQVLNNIGNIYWFQADYPAAIKFYSDALTQSMAVNDQKMITGLNLNLGLAYENLSMHDSAEYYYNKSLAFAKSMNDSSFIGLILVNKANSFRVRSNKKENELILKEAHTCENYLPTHIKCMLYDNDAKYNLTLKQYEKAKKNIETAKNHATQSGSLFAIRSYLEIKFQYDTAIHDYKSAIQTNLRLIELKDSIYNNEITNKTANFQAMYEVSKKENEIKILKANNELYFLQNKQNKLWLGILAMVFLFSVIIIAGIINSNRLKNKSIDALNVLNIELRAHKEELTTLNEELSMNQEELHEKNKYLESTISQLKLAQNHLIQSEKMASIGILARGVAHELINPLNFINGGISILQEAQEEDAQLQEKTAFPLQMMNEGIDRAVNIVRQLSTFVDQGNTKPQPTDINQVIKSTLVFLNHRIDLETQVVEEYAEIGECQCFPDKIHAIMFQMLINALDELKVIHTPKILKISTSVITINNNEFIEIKLWNSGNQISDENLPKLFDPFFTTKDANKGTGLGLTLVYNLVKEQQGTIAAQNSDNGVLFTVTIPRVL